MNKDTLFILVKTLRGVNLCEMEVRHLYLIKIIDYLCVCKRNVCKYIVKLIPFELISW